jgi:hypothetical protein
MSSVESPNSKTPEPSGICDGCSREFPARLLTPIAGGKLLVCPECLPKAIEVLKP